MALLAFNMQGCSSINPLDLIANDKPSLEVNANVGKNVEQEKNSIKLESGTKVVKQDAETISNDTSTEIKADIVNQITNNMTMVQVLWFGAVCFFVGWLAPDPLRVYKAAGYVIKDIVYGFIVNPIKGCIEYFRSTG